MIETGPARGVMSLVVVMTSTVAMFRENDRKLLSQVSMSTRPTIY